MSKKKDQVKLEEKIMLQIKSEEVKMKPRWYFLAGSSLLLAGLVLLSMGIMFLINLVSFAWRGHFPMMGLKLSLMLLNFPWWGLILAVLGMVVGVRLLKRYDFSYKRNFNLLVVIFVLTMLIAGLLFDRMGLNERLMKRGPKMRRFYEKVESRGLSRQSMPETYFETRFRVRGRD